MSIPGFRKGKAPINIVRKKYENNVLSESLDKLVQDKVRHLLEELSPELGVTDPVSGTVVLDYDG